MIATDPLDDVRAYLAQRDDDEPGVAPEMRSIVRSVVGAQEVVVLLHGLTASPPAWRAVADDLVASGRSVVAPRLALHGHADRLTRVLEHLTARRLIADTDGVFGRLAGTGLRITVAGHSLGGLLALHAGAHRDDVTRVVAIAPFLGAAVVPLEVHRLAFGILRRLPNVFLWWDPMRRERLGPSHGYPRYPTHAIAEAVRIADALPQKAHVPARVDIVLNAAESSVNNRSALRLARTWRARGASVAVYRLQGLQLSHDIIEPERRFAGRARDAIVDIVTSGHTGGDRVVHL